MVVQRRKNRQNSNVFRMLTKNQIVQLREAFNLMDINADSIISLEDLTTFLESIGSPFTKVEIEEMISELEPNPTFMVLLTTIGERLSEISSEEELLESFKIFDEDNDGLIDTDVLRYWMTERGNPINVSDFEYLIRGCEEDGRINYKKLSSKIKHGEIIDNPQY